MRRFFTALAAVGVLAAASPAAPARAQQPLTVSITQVIAAAYPDVLVVVGVQDAMGAPVAGLTTANFAATDSEGPIPIMGADAAVNADIGLAVVLVMDTSGSMEGAPLASAQEAAISFVDSLLPNDGAIVISFADEVSPASPLTADRTALAATLRGLQAVGATALHDAVISGAYSASATPLRRRVVVLLTDGQDSGDSSATGEEESLALAESSGVPFFTIGVGDAIYAPYLEDLASRTGGQFLAAPGPADIPAVYERIGYMLRSQYVLRLHMAAPADGGTTDLKLTVTARDVTTAASASFTRPGVPAASTPTPRPHADSSAPSVSDGSNSLILVFAGAAGAAGALALGGGIFGATRLRRRKPPPTEPAPKKAARKKATRTYTPPAAPIPDETAAPTARLTVVDGPDKGKSVDLGEEAITLGSDADCTLSLSDAGGRVAGQQARIWLREGQFMLHHLAGERYQTVVGGKALRWAVLEDGDEIVVGPHRLRFEAQAGLR